MYVIKRQNRKKNSYRAEKKDLSAIYITRNGEQKFQCKTI